MVDEPQSAPAPESPADVRKTGMLTAGVGIGLLLLMRVVIEIQIAMSDDGSFSIPQAIFVLPPVVVAFGLTQAITGRKQGWWRIPIVIVLAIACIAGTFALLVPRGY